MNDRIDYQIRQISPARKVVDQVMVTKRLFLLLVAISVSSCTHPKETNSQSTSNQNEFPVSKKSTKKSLKSERSEDAEREQAATELRNYALVQDKVMRAVKDGKLETAENEIRRFEQGGGAKKLADYLRTISAATSALNTQDQKKMCQLGRQLASSADASELKIAVDLLANAGLPKEAVKAQIKLMSIIKKTAPIEGGDFGDLAKLKAQAGDWKGCVEDLAYAVELRTKRPSFLKRSLWCSSRGDQNTLNELAGLKSQKNKDNHTLFDQARLESALGLDSAQNHFVDFCKKDKERAYLGHYYLGEIAYFKGDYEKSAREMAWVWNLDPTTLGKSRKYTYASGLTKTDNLIASWKRGGNAETCLEKGLAAHGVRNRHKAKEFYAKAYNELPKQSQAKLQAGILLYICQRQDGEFSQCKATLEDVGKIATSGWQEPLVRFFRNQLTEPELLALAKGNKTTLTRYYYYLSCIDLCMQDYQAEKKHLSWIKANGDSGVDEYELAEAMIDYLGAN